MEITPDVRAKAIEWAERRCECTGDGCRHHRGGSRCRKGLRGDDWKVYWRSEDAGATRENIEAWCLECFSNNFDVPRERVALFTADVAGFESLRNENYRRAMTLKSVLRDVAKKEAERLKGRVVFDRLDDDVLLEFGSSRDALEAARSIHMGYREMTDRLDLPTTPMRGAIHLGEVSRWRNGFLVGEAIDTAMSARAVADSDQVVITDPAVEPIRKDVELRQTWAEWVSPEPFWILEL